nr:hypothetical protein Iba_chr02bCG11010 [Ipomoea batatas]
MLEPLAPLEANRSLGIWICAANKCRSRVKHQWDSLQFCLMLKAMKHQSQLRNHLIT